jgi:phosphatidate cytidylyltransferase
MALRVASALGLALVALAATMLGGVAFALVWSCAATLFFMEFLAMVGYRPLLVGAALGAVGMVAAALGVERGLFLGSLGALSLTALAIAVRAETGTNRLLAIAGLLYAACVVLPVILLRSQPGHGLALTLWLYAVVWVTDIGAFFVGRSLGGPKLWKRVSPNKTWSGFVGGTVLGVGAALFVNRVFPAVELPTGVLIGLTVSASLAAHTGDLLESALKRRFSIKDSSQLIPGHGGFMDRLDGFALASLFVAVALRIAG